MTFDSPVEQCTEAVETLRAMPEVDLGQVRDNKLAIVVDTVSKTQDRNVWDAVQQLPNVTDLAIAMVAFDEDKDENP
ncbi:hypothetical protein [Crateriforma conspicua]|uniref:hypothetical protein n=1 Tax=Crateriforma conspicua TaxID=2527996 RepID=UPI0018C88362|nr:hypothetical protein [Crateriforma conspicua]